MNSKKLSLNKETVRQLTSEESILVGGATGKTKCDTACICHKNTGPTNDAAYTCVPTDGI